MISFFATTLFIFFTFLGSLHLYWFLGGKWGLRSVIPTKNIEEKAKPIPLMATLFVALVLFSFAILYLTKIEFVNFKLNWVQRFMYWVVSVIFLLRSIGDFNYVGFFKKIKYTEFGKADSKWFSPLCLIIGLIGVLIQLLD